MPETSEPKNTDGAAGRQSGTGAAGERVGDVLRTERMARSIAVETIAKDLKLNMAYINALEANDYSKLPPDPYVRVYLRSLASYLALDPDDILRRFYEERGIKQITYEQERSTRLMVSVKDNKPARTPWAVIIAIVVVLALVIYIANKQGWIASQPPPPETEQQGVGETDQEMRLEELLPDSSLQPTEIKDSVEVSGDERGEPQVQETDEEERSQAPPPERDSLTLTLSVTRDSVWVQVFADAASWRNYLRPGYYRSFTASDSLNIHVGRNELMRYMINGRRKKLGTTGVCMYKIDHDGVERWDARKWKRVFKDRLD